MSSRMIPQQLLFLSIRQSRMERKISRLQPNEHREVRHLVETPKRERQLSSPISSGADRKLREARMSSLMKMKRSRFRTRRKRGITNELRKRIRSGLIRRHFQLSDHLYPNQQVDLRIHRFSLDLRLVHNRLRALRLFHIRNERSSRLAPSPSTSTFTDGDPGE